MADIHLTMQEKGGVGKSYVSSLIAQKYLHRGANLKCIDTDVKNKSFSSIPALNAERFFLGDNPFIVEQAEFDKLMEEFAMAEEDRVFVVDTGSNTFGPLCDYLTQNGILDLIKSYGHEVYIHWVLHGGSELGEMVANLKAIFEYFPDVPVFVWLNEHLQGPVTREGRPFVKSKIYKEYEGRVKGVITLNDYRQSLFGKDLAKMTINRHTFEEAIDETLDQNGLQEPYRMVDVHRLRRLWLGANHDDPAKKVIGLRDVLEILP